MSAITFWGCMAKLLSNNIYNLYCLLSSGSLYYSLNNCLGSLLSSNLHRSDST